jgi:GxxExxY protein
MTKLIHAELTEATIGVYYDVYNDLSQTYPEFVYENSMMVGLEQEKGIPCVRQDEYEIWYKDRLVGKQRLDIFGWRDCGRAQGGGAD